MTDKWTAADIPDQRGRLAVVTGANSGIGFVTARELARAGARVVLAVRNAEKGADAARQIEAAVPNAGVEVGSLDLASLESVRGFAEWFEREHEGLDLLINNAGVAGTLPRLTADGFELQFGTNHLGHFALTGLLLGRMEGREDVRVVTVGGTFHRMGRINIDDLQNERGFGRWRAFRAYCQSKLANLLFAFELDRRLRAAGSATRSLAAHPGYAATNLAADAPMPDRLFMTASNRVFGQSAEMGALPTLYAATYPGLEGGTHIGPDRFFGSRGHPRLVGASAAARDEEAARKLWEVSEELTGVQFRRVGLRRHSAWWQRLEARGNSGNVLL
jgi:NAD(P)-dependent dehydrogenase (short-subunit alcohol dehydrogenase family)